jgi:hypothetical protein
VLTVLFLLVAAVMLACATIYGTRPAARLPSFFPGHATHLRAHRVDAALSAVALAVLALIAASFTMLRPHGHDDPANF